ncbi:hypothetical protein PJK55_14745 [Exiguobacterium sp. MMG028]|uniref:hypothetical protein n=1 Tax=Exiguobacterium sp. MMG028 TaxID=3021979 RepID=UPI0022FE0ED3|nr:hypothetical protein [Exiguobacterium sp. MMG028]MDA5561995.1 hypothetical protein [Exiguobacterium sp. MMG028]
MKRYTLEEREEQIKQHRLRTQYTHDAFKHVSEDEKNSEHQRSIALSFMSIYQDVLDDIDYIFGKEETE